MILAGILGTFEQDLVFLLVALVLFGKRLPEVANTVGRKVIQFRRGIDEMKSEITKPIREHLEAPIREASNLARQAALDAERDVRLAAERAEREVAEAKSTTRQMLDTGGAPACAPAEGPPAPIRDPFPYPGAPRDVEPGNGASP